MFWWKCAASKYLLGINLWGYGTMGLQVIVSMFNQPHEVDEVDKAHCFLEGIADDIACPITSIIRTSWNEISAGTEQIIPVNLMADLRH